MEKCEGCGATNDKTPIVRFETQGMLLFTLDLCRHCYADILNGGLHAIAHSEEGQAKRNPKYDYRTSPPMETIS